MDRAYFLLILLSLPVVAQVEREAIIHNAIPDLDKRDKTLKNVKGMVGWGELKKDIFYMDLESKSLFELQEKYPQIKKEDLKSLKDKRIKK